MLLIYVGIPLRETHTTALGWGISETETLMPLPLKVWVDYKHAVSVLCWLF